MHFTEGRSLMGIEEKEMASCNTKTEESMKVHG